jgi:predicted protein tyrosine phosphatase
MWAWTLNWGEIRNDLVIGSGPITTVDIDSIRQETSATALLSLQTDECRKYFKINYSEHQQHSQRIGLVLVNTPMRDFDPTEQRHRLPTAVRGLTRLIEAGHKVYVHCTAGFNRSPLTVLGYLTFVEGMATKEALALIKRGRPEADPYLDAYHGCRQDLIELYKNDIEQRARELSRNNPGNSPDANWHQAQKEIVRELFSASIAR